MSGWTDSNDEVEAKVRRRVAAGEGIVSAATAVLADGELLARWLSEPTPARKVSAREEIARATRRLHEQEPGRTRGECLMRTLEEHPALYAQALREPEPTPTPPAAERSEARPTGALERNIVEAAARRQAVDPALTKAAALIKVLAENPRAYAEWDRAERARIRRG